MSEPLLNENDRIEFIKGYTDHLLLTTLGEDHRPLSFKYSQSDITPQTKFKIWDDCTQFLKTNGVLDMLKTSQLKYGGMSFLETRNGHGVCRWDDYYNNSHGDFGDIGLGFEDMNWLTYGRPGRELAAIAKKFQRFKLVPSNGQLSHIETERE